MTILTKPSIVIKKPDGLKSPLVVENGASDEEKVDIYPQPSVPEQWQRKRSAGALFCMSLVALLVAIAGISCGLMLYRQYLRSTGLHRHKGFCAIPMENNYRPDMISYSNDQLIEPNYNEHRSMPLRWSPEPDVQVFSVGNDEPSDALNNALREEFEVGNRLETIRVYDNGRTVTFIHDFDDNVTGIVDQDRCFMMDLDPSLVLDPAMLVFGMQNGEEFDITRVRSTLRAVLPALQEITRRARVLAEKCMQKPVYGLEKGDGEGVVIRKRAVDEPSHDYIQFAGKRVQEIDIANMAQLLEYEQGVKQAA